MPEEEVLDVIDDIHHVLDALWELEASDAPGTWHETSRGGDLCLIIAVSTQAVRVAFRPLCMCPAYKVFSFLKTYFVLSD